MAEPIKADSSRASISIPPQSLRIPSGTAPTPAARANEVATPVGPAKTRARVIGAERTISKLLRAGAMMSVGLLGASILVEAMPATESTGVAIDLLRKAGLATLVLTPLARLTAAGAVLAAKGEWRYAMYGAGVLLLLGIALGTGFGV